MLAYILQVILFQLLFLLVYEVLLKKETFFSYNRWYLLSTSVISLLLPMVKIAALAFLIPSEAISEASTIWLPAVLIGEVPAAAQAVTAEASNEIFKINWWLVVYSTGVVASLFIFLKKYQNLNRLFRFRAITAERNLRIIEVPNSTIACTFYKTIFLGDQLTEVERQQILCHELVHVKQNHSLDLIFFELYKIIFWFNPLIYIYQERIATLHEFIADAAVVQNTEKRNYYEQLLNSAFNTQNISFINQFFNHSLIRLTAFGRTITFGTYGGQLKKRIVMLQKSRSKSVSKIKFLALLPLILVMLTYVACSDGDAKIENEDSLSQYTYTMKKGEEMDAKTKEIHINYETFLRNNPDYVSWAERNGETGEMTYSVHPREEKVPAEYSSHEITSTKDGSSYTTYFIPPLGSGSNIKQEKMALDEVVIGFDADVEEIPLYKDCDEAGSGEEKKACMSKMFQKHVVTRFDTGIGKELGLAGRNQIITTFTIDKNGRISQLRVRAPHPALEEEAKRVINSLPQMTPARNNGEEIEISYSLPITFQVNR